MLLSTSLVVRRAERARLRSFVLEQQSRFRHYLFVDDDNTQMKNEIVVFRVRRDTKYSECDAELGEAA